MQSWVECWQPLVCFPYGGAELPNLCAFSQFRRLGTPFCMCSLAVCKGLLMLPLGVHSEPARDGSVCGWGVWKVWGTRLPVGGILRQGGSWLDFLMSVCIAINGIHVSFYVFWEHCCSPSHSPPHSHVVHLNILGGVNKKLVSLAVSCTTGKLGCSLTISFPSWEKSD